MNEKVYNICNESFERSKKHVFCIDSCYVIWGLNAIYSLSSGRSEEGRWLSSVYKDIVL